MSSPTPDFDIVIIGGGMVGATAASLFARAGFSVAVVDPKPPEPFDDSAEVGLRVSAISPGSAAILEQAGAWKSIERSRHCHYPQMIVEDDNRDHQISFEAPVFGMARLGTIVENSLIRQALWQAIESNAMVTLFCPDVLDHLDSSETGSQVVLGSGTRISCSLVVAADGANSFLRTLAGFDSDVWEYDQKGLVCTVGKTENNPGIAWQRFWQGNPLAFLPLADGRSSIVWTCQSREAERLLRLDDGSFIAELDEASSGWLGHVTELGTRGAFPLQMRLARRYVGQGVVLLGDAAHVVHPLAGQGVNLGLADAAALVETMLKVKRGQDRNQSQLLERFDIWRRSESELMATGIHALRTVYGHDALGGIRAAGLRVLSATHSAREQFLLRATGQGRNSPRLARGEPLRSLMISSSE